MAVKNYFVKPDDGWVQVITAGHAATVRISSFPFTHPFYVFSDPSSTPGLTDRGVLVAHRTFKIENFTTNKNVEAFWVRVTNTSNQNSNGAARIDVYTDGGTLT